MLPLDLDNSFVLRNRICNNKYACKGGVKLVIPSTDLGLRNLNVAIIQKQ